LLLFIDFTKTFDMVKHSLLFKKLLNYGFLTRRSKCWKLISTLESSALRLAVRVQKRH
jgi:hypothetical protein